MFTKVGEDDLLPLLELNTYQPGRSTIRAIFIPQFNAKLCSTCGSYHLGFTEEPRLTTTSLIRPLFWSGKTPVHFLIKTPCECDHPVYATNDHLLIPEVHFSLFLTSLIRPLIHAYKLQ